ncbi:MAG: YitT family protein [Lachnobacterium sp.]|nr:YitT family protein [Lachnobacterium sp.]MCI7086761.1 YitT family protein [Lachnobacterium sp.]MCI7532378.1 YitT family protein [Lachnobacterium sp.]MDD7713051.1 YitT family protein [Lachnobacterium sp.]MDY5460690.1 YitT family protein [Agathobacter sp.]
MNNMSNRTKQIAWNYVLILVGTAVMALAIQCIYDRVGLVTGGFTGLTIIIRNITKSVISGGIPLWFANIVLNIPVFIYSYVKFGKKFVGRTLFATIMLSVWLYIIPGVDLSGDDYLLAALFGGVFTGVGMGIVLRAGATTGGTDMVAALIQTKMRHYSVVQIMQVMDAAIVIAGLYVFGLRSTLYAVVSIFVSTKVSDGFLEGFKNSKAALIITNHYKEVAARVMDELGRGVTGMDAKGMYTQDYKCVLYCVVSRKEIVQLKEIVNDVDPDAFVIVSDVREVLGEGFMEYSSQDF